MLNHSDFTTWLTKTFPNTDSSLINKIVLASAVGVAPEGKGSPALNRLVDAIYKAGLVEGLEPQPVPIPPSEDKKFSFGQRSLERLTVLLPQLRQVTAKALSLSMIDFTVLQTIRTLEEQKAAVASGHSRTMNSKHLRQPDGFAHAVDLGAWVDGKVNWTFDLYADIAFAMDEAATSLGYAQHVRWGCAWDRVLSDFGGDHKAYIDEAKAYASRHIGSDLLDAPHFEWVP
jgi:peptidoglycan L-alanyl-D-glutamate endopeptidase CwlK